MLVDINLAMWNAGLVALSGSNKLSILNKAFASTDEMCEQNVERWLIEQLSLSQALRLQVKLNLRPNGSRTAGETKKNF